METRASNRVRISEIGDLGTIPRLLDLSKGIARIRARSIQLWRGIESVSADGYVERAGRDGDHVR